MKKNVLYLIIAVLVMSATLLSSSIFYPLSVYGTPPLYPHCLGYTRITGIEDCNTEATELSIYDTGYCLAHPSSSMPVRFIDEAEWRTKHSHVDVLLGEIAYIDMSLKANIMYEVTVTELASPQFLGKWEDLGPFYLSEDEKNYYFMNKSYSCFAYGFKINTRVTGDISVVVNSYKEAGWPYNLYRPGMAKATLPDLIAEYNKWCYAKDDRVDVILEAPTLLTGEVIEGYIGILGMWLSEYNVKNHVDGTAADLSPQVTGQPLMLYSDIDKQRVLWSAEQGEYDPETLGDEFVYYPDHYAAEWGVFTININELGTTVIFDDTRQYPNYWCWAYNSVGEGDGLPAVSQIVRVDIVLASEEPFQIPKYQIPDFTPVIDIPTIPENRGNPLPLPTTPSFPWNWFLLLVTGAIALTITVTGYFYFSKGSRRG